MTLPKISFDYRVGGITVPDAPMSDDMRAVLWEEAWERFVTGHTRVAALIAGEDCSENATLYEYVKLTEHLARDAKLLYAFDINGPRQERRA